jgi:hypothetical protein
MRRHVRPRRHWKPGGFRWQAVWLQGVLVKNDAYTVTGTRAEQPTKHQACVITGSPSVSPNSATSATSNTKRLAKERQEEPEPERCYPSRERYPRSATAATAVATVAVSQDRQRSAPNAVDGARPTRSGPARRRRVGTQTLEGAARKVLEQQRRTAS